jgi:two-component system, cell cycle sensor histidine kinase and response regulator CckA
MSSTFQSLTAPLWVVIGICLASGLHHLFVAMRHARGASNLAFAIVCLAVAGYAAANLGLYSTHDPEAYRFYLKSQIAMAFVSGIALVWFVAFYTRVTPWLVLALITAYGGALLTFHVMLPLGLFFDEFRGLGVIRLAWGGEVHFPLVDYDPLRTRLGDVNAVVHVFFVVYACWRQYTRGERRAALTLAFCIFLYLGFSIHDVALARHILIDQPAEVARVPLQEFGFVSLIVLMSLRLSEEVLDAAAVRRALVESEENLRITLDSIGDAVITTDARGRITRMNPVATELTGWSIEAAANRPLPEIFRIVNVRTRQPVANPVDRVLATGGLVGLANHTALIGRDGTERQIADSGAPIRDSRGRVVGVVLVFRDVTDQYHLEEQLRHSQKMEAVGRLAGGIAHDFNNLLQAIQGYTTIALAHAPDEGRTRGDLEEVLRTVDRAAVLVRQLLTFSRRQPFKPEPLDINNLISDLIKLLRRVIGVNIELSVHFDNDLPPVDADRGQIEQVLMNLCVNARDAMPEGGEIRIQTGRADLDEAFCQAHPWAKPGRYSLVSVSDDGVGMDADVMERIFEPYFTTKNPSEGTGLGLSTVFAIVQRHEGLLHATSTPGAGSTLHVYLPGIAASPDADLNSTDRSASAAGSGIVLLAEDEEAVRNLAVYSLEGAGYRVLTARDGNSALELFEQFRDAVDVAVIDLIMPGMGGRSLAERLREGRPELPVVFCSGYTPDDLERRIADDPRTILLMKPHPATELLRAVRSVLDAAQRV